MAIATARHFRPRRVVPRYMSKETRTDVTWVESLLSESTKLNQVGRTFSRGTSAWDPKYNRIVPPGVARQRPLRYLDRYTIQADLIEGAGANLLTAGSSDHVTLWVKDAADFSFDQVAMAPNGEMTIGKYVEGTTTTFHTLRQNLTVAASALPYVWQFYIQALPGDINVNKIVAIDDTGSNAVRMTINPTAGTIVAPAAVAGSGWTSPFGSMVRWSNGWMVTIGATNNSVTTLRCIIWDNGIASTLGDGVSGFYFGMADLKQSTITSSVISNRNLVLFSNVLNGTGWGNGGSNASIASGGGTLPSGETAWTFTAGASFGDWQRAITVTAGSVMTYSFWAKSGTLALPGCLVYDNIHFANIVAPNISSQINASTFTRVTVTFTVPAGCTQIIICPGYSLGGTGTTFIGDCQLEYGPIATAYWGVDATVGGRDVEALSVPYAMPTAAGTIVALCMPMGWSTDQDGSTLFRVFDAYLAGAEKLVLRRNSSTQVILGTVDQVGGKNATAITAGFTNGVLEQIASVWDSTSVRAYVNGVHASTDSAAPSLPFISTDTLWIGCSSGGFNEFFGYVALITEPRAWTALELSLVGTAQLVAP